MIETGNSGIVKILCDNETKKKDIIALIAGMEMDNGVCIIGNYNTQDHLEEYKKKIDVIDIERIDSMLSVRNYLVFYAMVTGIYSEELMKNFEGLLRDVGMENVLGKSIEDIDKMEKIIVRCLAAYTKNIICLVGKNLLMDLEEKQKERLIIFLRKYFADNRCLCLLFEDVRNDDNSMVDKVIVV